MSTLSDFAYQLERMVADHGFTAISVDINTAQDADSRFGAALHFDDAIEGNGCVLANGPTIAAAINNAYRTSLRKRPVSLEIVSEAA
jgi:hypothetical protein